MPRKQYVMAEEFAREKERQKQLLGSALAERMGPPPGAHRMSDAQLVEKWNLRDPAVTDETIATLQANGATPEDITRAAYPHRESTYTIGVRGQQAQLKEAERLAALAEKSRPTTSPPAFLEQSLGPMPTGTAEPLSTNQPPPNQPALSVPEAPAPTPAMPSPQHIAGSPSAAGPKRQSEIEGYY